jgi:hypothetical protein
MIEPGSPACQIPSTKSFELEQPKQSASLSATFHQSVDLLQRHGFTDVTA